MEATPAVTPLPQLWTGIFIPLPCISNQLPPRRTSPIGVDVGHLEVTSHPCQFKMEMRGLSFWYLKVSPLKDHSKQFHSLGIKSALMKEVCKNEFTTPQTGESMT